jgi:hypothetical protein
MNVWEQEAGKWWNDGGVLLGVGYSGGDCGSAPENVNSPLAQSFACSGPIPQGLYTIGAPQDTIVHGPYVLPLTPDPANQMYGRSGFLVHGDSVLYPGQKAASEGCIVLPKTVRQQIWESGDRDLKVVSGLPYPDVDGEIAT